MTGRQRKHRISRRLFLSEAYDGAAAGFYWRCPCKTCGRFRKSRSVVKWR